MKIRLTGNSVRLRLSKSAIEKLETAGYMEERVCFGNNTLVYALQSKDYGDAITADYDGNKITVFMPAALIDGWGKNNVVSHEAVMRISDTESLSILVEKDFKCLDNPIEDQSDNYENPNKTC